MPRSVRGYPTEKVTDPNFSLFCPKCKLHYLIDAKNLEITFVLTK